MLHLICLLLFSSLVLVGVELLLCIVVTLSQIATDNLFSGVKLRLFSVLFCILRTLFSDSNC